MRSLEISTHGNNAARAALAMVCALTLLPSSVCAASSTEGRTAEVVGSAIRPIMERYGIPGMAVGIIVDGHPYVYDYGV
ncbi:MAG TPA: hypothetical protein VIK27_11505, partial [Candidatus Aquilonibacter sp.]